jgi:hypothetical protein
VNRLTKHISLVLISSSLILHGCHSEPTDEEKKGENAPSVTPGTAGSGSHYYHSGPHFFHTGGYRSGTSVSSGSSRSGSSTGTHSSAGSSSRGGFGGSAHGIAS